MIKISYHAYKILQFILDSCWARSSGSFAVVGRWKSGKTSAARGTSVEWVVSGLIDLHKKGFKAGNAKPACFFHIIYVDAHILGYWNMRKHGMWLIYSPTSGMVRAKGGKKMFREINLGTQRGSQSGNRSLKSIVL